MAASRAVSRAAWTVLVPFVTLLAILAVVVMVRENTGAEEVSGNTVSMARLAFNPGDLTVPAGSEIVFDNADVAPHTVTADDRSVDSGIIDPGKAFKLVVSEPFTYHCEVHPSMKAEILLEG